MWHMLYNQLPMQFLLSFAMPQVIFLSWQMVGKTLVYIVEIVNKVRVPDINYGIITRESPVR